MNHSKTKNPISKLTLTILLLQFLKIHKPKVEQKIFTVIQHLTENSVVNNEYFTISSILLIG